MSEPLRGNKSAKFRERLRRLEDGLLAGRVRPSVAPHSRYRHDPAGYARDVLGVEITDAQRRLGEALLRPPFKVLCQAGHNVGKSFAAAWLINWWFDTRRPGICLTTAPTDRQVKDILWKEVRLLRKGRGGFPGPAACRLQDAPDHFAHGFTARDGDRFQGHHSPAVMIVFDEATGVDPVFWEAAETMLGGTEYCFLGIFNPTDTGSQAYTASQSGRFTVLSMSCLDHPNIVAESQGLPAPIPSAIHLDRLLGMLEEWCEELGPNDEAREGDVTVAGRRFRPGPVADARLLGRWYRQSLNSVWDEAAWLRCLDPLPLVGPLEFGLDVARFGDDNSALHGRVGGRSMHHSEWNGLGSVDLVHRAIEILDREAARLRVDAKRVPVKVDDTGVGGGVTDYGRHCGYNFVPVNFGERALDDERYPNKRSELWFSLAEEARSGNVSFAALPEAFRADLRKQLFAPLYKLDARGRRVVEPKKDTKARIGRSPDTADSVMLAYAVASTDERLVGNVRVP